jgi:hypothetical protein
LNDNSDSPQTLFHGNKKLRQQTLTQQWPTEEEKRPPAFLQQEDPLPKGWVSRFDQLSGEDYFYCEETEDLVFLQEELFRKKPANNSISSRRSVSSSARTSSTITTAASDRPNFSILASPCSRKIRRPDFVESSFVTPPALGNGSSQNDPIIFSDNEEKSFGSADLPDTEDMDMMVAATTINRYRGDEREHNNTFRPPTHDMMGAAVVLSHLTAVGRSTPRHSNQQRRTTTSSTSMQLDSGSDSSKTLF